MRRGPLAQTGWSGASPSLRLAGWLGCLLAGGTGGVAVAYRARGVGASGHRLADLEGRVACLLGRLDELAPRVAERLSTVAGEAFPPEIPGAIQRSIFGVGAERRVARARAWPAIFPLNAERVVDALRLAEIIGAPVPGCGRGTARCLGIGDTAASYIRKRSHLPMLDEARCWKRERFGAAQGPSARVGKL